MAESKSKRLVTGSVLGGISFILRMFIALFMTPFMITSFGNQTYGLWILVASLSGLYGILDFGLASAVQRYMSRSMGNKDYEEINTVFNTSLIVFCGIGVLAIIFAGVIAGLAPVFVKTAENISLFRKVILIISASIVIGFPMRSFWGILAINLRYDISSWLEIVTVVIKTVFIVVFLKQGYGVVAVAMISLISDVIWHVANIIFSLRVAPYIRFSLKYFNAEKIRIFLNYSVYAFISRIADIIKFNIDSYVISAFIGLNSVTIYSVGVKLVQFTGDFVFRSLGIMTPVFSQYEGQGDFKNISEKFFFLLKITTYISVFLGFLLLVLGRAFIERWVGQGYEDSTLVVYIFVIPSVFTMMMTASNQLLYGVSKHKFLAWINGAEAIVNFILSLVFVQFWGIKGVALGTAIPMVIVKVFIQPVYTAHVLKVSVASFYARMFVETFKSAFVLLGVYFIANRIIDASYIRLFTAGFFFAACYFLIIFKFGFLALEQKQLIGAVLKKNYS